jgi:hypothetical protein
VAGIRRIVASSNVVKCGGTLLAVEGKPTGIDVVEIEKPDKEDLLAATLLPGSVGSQGDPRYLLEE